MRNLKGSRFGCVFGGLSTGMLFSEGAAWPPPRNGVVLQP